jgi:hypothetical protein
MEVFTGFIWLRIKTSEGLLWTQQGISWVAKQLLAYQEGIGSMELVTYTYKYKFCESKTDHCHYVISGCHSNELSSIDTWHERKLCSR